jgi:hypothetical protein
VTKGYEALRSGAEAKRAQTTPLNEIAAKGVKTVARKTARRGAAATVPLSEISAQQAR